MEAIKPTTKPIVTRHYNIALAGDPDEQGPIPARSGGFACIEPDMGGEGFFVDLSESNLPADLFFYKGRVCAVVNDECDEAIYQRLVYLPLIYNDETGIIALGAHKLKRK